MMQDAPSLSNSHRIAHLVSLRNLGGVERYFSRFFDCYAKER